VAGGYRTVSIVFTAPITDYPYYNRRPISVLSATNADPAYPIENVMESDPTKVFRTTTGSTVINLQFSTTGHTFFDVISLVHTNTSYRATLKIELSTNGSAWSTHYDGPFWANLSTVQSTFVGDTASDADPRRHSLERNMAYVRDVSWPNYSWAYIRLTITDPLVSKITIGRLFVGRSFVPTYGHQYGSSISFTDYGRSERTDRGVMIMEPGLSITSATVKMDFLTKKEMYDFAYDFNKFIGSSRDFMVCLNTEDKVLMQKNTLYCTIAEGRTISFDSFNTHSQSWTLESIA
jgi:hypothetical protein